MAVWLRRHGTFVTLALHVQPGARRTEVAGAHGDALKIRLAARPVDGKANADLIEFFASCLKRPKSSIHLVSGQSSRHKILKIDPAPADVEKQLLELLP
jgi:uncharacterized protein (TIGR00251 family)